MRLARLQSVSLAVGAAGLAGALLTAGVLAPVRGRPQQRPAVLPSVGASGPTLEQRSLQRTLAGLPQAGTGDGPAVPENVVAAGFGTLDPTFGTKGTVVTNVPGRQVGASDLALLDDQSIVVAGGALMNDSSDFLITRYSRNGALDPTFGTAGVVTTSWPSAQGANGAAGVAVGSNNRILVAGTAGLGQGSDIGVALAQYRPNGALDPTFGNGGKVVTSVSPVGDGGGSAVTIQPDGKIVVVGGASDQQNNADFLAVRYLATGAIDTSFGNNGVALIPMPGGDSSGSGVAVQRDGAIVVVGTAIVPAAGQEFGIARLTPGGVLDPTFGSGGIVLAQFRTGQDKGGAQSVAIGRDGRIVVAGLGETSAGHASFGLMRLLIDGSLDPTFGTGGKVLTEFAGESIATRVVLRGDGGMVAVGSAGFPSRVALVGYRADGQLDPAFGTHGRTLTAIGPASAGTSAVAQSSGSIIVAGTSAAADFATGGFALARYLGVAGCTPPICQVGLG